MALPATTAAALLAMAALVLTVRSTASAASAPATPSSSASAALTPEALLRPVRAGFLPTIGRTTFFPRAARLTNGLAAAALRFFS
jgi:hypothetical protein